MAAIVPFIQVQEFEAEPDVPYYIRIEEVMVLMPIFRKKLDCIDVSSEIFIDSTGEYDLCMTADFKRWQFISRRPTTEIFCYRFVSSFFPQSAWRGIVSP
jgi:hypothetical protein